MSDSKAEGERLREYARAFLNALRPIIVAATNSSMEIELARMFILGQPATNISQQYHKHMDKMLNGRPVWHWIANKNEQVLTENPEVLLGTDYKMVKDTAQKWIAVLTAPQRETVWAWLHGFLQLAGYDITEALEQR
jgi:hypothetical protein